MGSFFMVCTIMNVATPLNSSSFIHLFNFNLSDKPVRFYQAKMFIFLGEFHLAIFLSFRSAGARDFAVLQNRFLPSFRFSRFFLPITFLNDWDISGESWRDKHPGPDSIKYRFVRTLLHFVRLQFICMVAFYYAKFTRYHRVTSDQS